jgi:FkbM family methyltransferase
MRAVFRAEHEQTLVSSYLPVTGFFVEVGAFHPVALSQTWQLERRGWDGLLIEPIPEHAENLRRERRAQVFEVACGKPEQDGMTLPIYVAGGLSSLRFRRGPPKSVPLATLDSLLVRAGASQVDFLSVDVEGSELDVLRGFSFERFRPRLILLEDFAEGLAKHRFMQARGYRLVRRTGDNSWYVPNEVPF